MGEVTVGALPDMLTFSADGRYVLVANEGEPSDDYSVDPEGSVSVIDLSNGVASATVANAGFGEFERNMAELMDQGLRVFGPGASLAQDMEPEYIALSIDGETAWVALQENNAVAELDIAAGEITAISQLLRSTWRRAWPEIWGLRDWRSSPRKTAQPVSHCWRWVTRSVVPPPCMLLT